MVEITERNFEESITASLLSGGPDSPTSGGVRENPQQGDYIPGGYNLRQPQDYDRALCLIPRDVMDFIMVTQPREWEKLRRNSPRDVNVEEHFLERINHEIGHHGLLHVLRKGVKDLGCKFSLAYFPPASGLNPETRRRYLGNIFSVIRQVKYSQQNENSLDMVLFLNGLPLFTVELKNPLTGQTVNHAMTQYRNNRDPRESLFKERRCLAHFAVDSQEVFFTTHLDKQQTRFIPFNRGHNLGAGNPPAWQGYATSYLWEQVWARDSVLNLIQYFVHETEAENGGKGVLFPRYHQLDAVRRLVSHARTHGAGQHYLVQHSAGSGKSNSIAWLAHQLSVLHDEQDQLVFNSVLVITDRRVLDRQLQNTVQQFEQTLGTVENITETSRQLKDALEEGKKIIVTTLQKFPVISQEMGSLPGSRFAVIIDEAHSSQSGEATRHLNTVLSAGSLEEAEQQDGEEEEDLEDRIAREISQRGQLPNVSYFAFTATPKAKTLELFGMRVGSGFQPFSLYPMRQAIEEGFILDVLQNYTTYHAYWSLLKKIQDDPAYDRGKAVRLLLSFVEMHEHTIGKKVEVIVEHFMQQVLGRIDGRAKAMIVTRSRLHAVLYKQAVDAYLAAHHYPVKALVAFSGTVHYGGLDYTESSMNGFPERQTANTFAEDDIKFLIVAEKFQTGFDQPLLHTMYVDKRLRGLHAVQTLSRLNRTHPRKQETFVLDFANSVEDIQKAFEPYYERTLLSEATDPNLLYDLQTRLESFGLFTTDEVNAFAQVYFGISNNQSRLHNILRPVHDRYRGQQKEKRSEFRTALGDYVRLYAFLSQIATFTDNDLEKLYHFSRYLLRLTVEERERLPVEIQRAIDLESYRLDQTSSGQIVLNRGRGELEPEDPLNTATQTPADMEALSIIIRELNQRFGTNFSEDDRLVLHQLEQQLAVDSAVEQSVRVNTPENALLTFKEVLENLLQNMVDTNFRFYKQVNDDPEFGEMLTQYLYNRYRASRGLAST